MARLSGTGQLADDLFLLAHNDVTGKPLLQDRALGIGLAGGLLADLALDGAIDLDHGALVVVGRAPARDGLKQSILKVLADEPERHPVRTWLQFFAHSSVGDVAERLAEAGYLTRAGRGGRRARRWVPVDPDCAFAPLVRVRAAMDASRPLTTHGAALAGLATACGLNFRLARAAPIEQVRSQEEVRAHLPPNLRDLIAQTQAAVDSALLSHRL